MIYNIKDGALMPILRGIFNMEKNQVALWSNDCDTLATLRQGIEHIVETGARSLIIFATSDHLHNESELNALLNACPIPVCGGYFPKLIHNKKVMSSGAVIIGLPIALSIYNYTEISKKNKRLDTYIASHTNMEQFESFTIFADAQSHCNEDLIDLFYENIGAGITVIGGCAGFLDFKHRPCLFTNDGIISDAVQVVGVPSSMTQTIGHGWEVCDGPYLVTDSEGHNVKSLNYQPAFELYRDAIRKVSGKEITNINFLDIAKDFPLGIANFNGEFLVRDPVTTDLQSLEFLGNVPANATVHLLTGNHQKLIASAKEAAKNLVTVDNPKLLLLFDCISRVLYLEDDFSEEITALQSANTQLPLVGVLSLGEIANTNNSAVHLLNKSTVLGML